MKELTDKWIKNLMILQTCNLCPQHQKISIPRQQISGIGPSWCTQRFYLRTVHQQELPILPTRTCLIDQPLNAAKQKRISPWRSWHRFTDILPNGNLEHLTLRSMFRPLEFDEQWMMNTPPFSHKSWFSVIRRHKYLLHQVSNLGLTKKAH